MSFVERFSRKIAEFVVCSKHVNGVHETTEGISTEIEELRLLKEELIRKERELQQSRVEWDRTFDAIIDNIIIINKDRLVTNYNKAFELCMEKSKYEGKVIGQPWQNLKDFMELPSDRCIVEECFRTGEHGDTTITSKGLTFNICVNPVIENGEVISVVRVSRDVTKLEKQKELFKRRADLFKTVSDMSAVLVNHDEWKPAINDILCNLGESLGAHRAYIFQNEVTEKRICADMIDFWINDDRFKNCDMNDCINYDYVPDMKVCMEHGNPIRTTLPQCNICEKKDHCICSDEVVVTAVPIFCNKQWWGFIGFDFNSDDRPLSEEDETILRIAADIIGGVIYHRERYFKCVDGK